MLHCYWCLNRCFSRFGCRRFRRFVLAGFHRTDTKHYDYELCGAASCSRVLVQCTNHCANMEFRGQNANPLHITRGQCVFSILSFVYNSGYNICWNLVELVLSSDQSIWGVMTSMFSTLAKLCFLHPSFSIYNLHHVSWRLDLECTLFYMNYILQSTYDNWQ